MSRKNCDPVEVDSTTVIFLGKMSDMDPREDRAGAENAASVLGGKSLGSVADPLWKDRVELTTTDKNGDGVIRDESEYVSHDADGDGNQSSQRIDSTFQVQGVKVTFRDDDGGTYQKTLTLRIMQDKDGNVFLLPPPKGASATEVNALTTDPIVSIVFPTDKSCYKLDYNGIYTDRHDFPCFVRGTLIETEHGPVPVEELVPGMMVLTRDHGLQPLRWIGSRALESEVLDSNPNLRPIRIAAGALGKDLPRRDLLVSPQHRILVRSKIAQKMFGATEVLVAAKQLLQIAGIDVAADLAQVEYYHFLFDQHEIVLSEGAETESLYTGPEALKAVGSKAQAEIFALFPELRDRAEDAMPLGARLLASGRMGRKLAVRHAQHRKALVQ
ncbi:Hint domain-containing protein [Paracoccus thiocyanatus]|nr:Hint domain-containing protein [Paracoccus thiocyanatus]